MDRFIIRENIKHYLKLLERSTDEQERAQLRALLAEERRKQRERETRSGTPSDERS
ncbi:MAG TPA: hypothetical protein VLX44_15855 [Xanthobacteraceae bacterium]|nr:hypothetical protein [Xanthobacteraceae bacterium]